MPMQSPPRTRIARVATDILAICLLAAVGPAWTWQQARPSHERDWQEEVRLMAGVAIRGDSVHLENLRDFRYENGVAAPRWMKASFDLADVRRAWFVLSPFHPRIKAMAHPFLSFELADGRFLGVSVEARKQEGQSYSAVRGLLRSYETIVVLATEEDLLGVRAVVRQEPLHLFPLRVGEDEARALLRALLVRARELEARPEFYNTLTNNCTTNLIDPINAMVDEDVPWTVGLMPGYSVEEAYARGWLDTDRSLDAARTAHRVDDRVRKAYGAPDFSRRIREGM